MGLADFKAKLSSNNERYKILFNSRFFVTLSFDNGYITYGGGSEVGEYDGLVEIVGAYNKNYLESLFIKDFDYYVHELDLPNYKGEAKSLDELSETNMGYGLTIGSNSLVSTQDNKFNITFNDTENSIIDHFLEPWMRFCNSPRFIYNGNKSQQQKPMATMKVYVFGSNEKISKDNTSNAIRVYKITGVYPITLETPDLNHEDSIIIERKCEFAFNKLFITRPHY